MIEIKRGIPMPRAQSRNTLDLPFGSMDVGDSFEVEIKQYGETGSTLTKAEHADYVRHLEGKIRSAASRHGKRLHTRFAVRRLDAFTMGVWRTE